LDLKNEHKVSEIGVTKFEFLPRTITKNYIFILIHCCETIRFTTLMIISTDMRLKMNRTNICNGINVDGQREFTIVKAAEHPESKPTTNGEDASSVTHQPGAGL
jgi:hypothetical protein